MSNPFVTLFAANPGPEALVRQGLRLLEGELREQALVALAGWEWLEVPTALWLPAVPELFSAIGSLQRPSWGGWNGLLTALRKARNTVVRQGDAALRERLEQAKTLNGVLARLEEPAEPALVQGLQPLSRLVRSKLPARPRLGQVLALPISLRNRMAHDMPSDPAWWQEAAKALRPLLGFHARPGAHDRIVLPAPWFVVEANEVWSFNGLEHDGAVICVSRQGATRHDAERGQAVLLAFQRLLGQGGIQERDFKKLLATLAPEEVKGVLLGDYLLGPPVGSGGFATVHVGRQLSTGRKVALKVLHDGMDDEQRQRFQQEAAYLARLDHPHIVSVLGHGEDAWSPPRAFSLSGEAWFQQFSRTAPIKSYIALEWIDGQTLESWIRQGGVHQPEVRILAGWFAEAAEALAAVHGAGLIHRDLKPSNLMMTAAGRVKLMDFGIARSQTDARTLHTATGQTLGTPAYMAPEQLQASAAAAAVGPASDVYGLCATFYELFTGARLYHHDTLDHATVLTRKLAGERPEPPRRLAPGLPWEIETLLLGGLEREPKDRPTSAANLAADLRRFLANQPIRYKRPPLHRRIQLFYRRNRSLVQLAAGSAALLLLVAVIAVWLIGGERGRTVAQKERADIEETRRKEEEEKAKEAARLKFFEEYQADMQIAPGLFATAKVDLLRDRLRKYEQPGEHDPRGFEWHYWWRICQSELRTIRSKDGRLRNVVFDAEGQRLAAVSWDGLATVWNVSTGTELYTIPGHTHCLAFSPDKKLLASARGGGVQSQVWLLDAATGKALKHLGDGLRIWCLAFSPDGKLLVAGDAGANLWLWAVPSGKHIINLSDHPRSTRQVTVDPTRSLDKQQGPVLGVAFRPDGKVLASASEDGTVNTWLVPAGTRLRSFRGHSGPVTSVVFSPDGTLIASSSHGRREEVSNAQPGEILVREWVTGEVAFTFKRRDYEPPPGDFRAVFSPDGKYLIGAVERTAKVWEMPGGQEINQFVGHTNRVLSAAVSPDGRLVATASEDETVKVWDARPRHGMVPFFQHAHGVLDVAVSPDGSRVAAICETGGNVSQDLRGLRVFRDMRDPRARSFTVRQFDMRTGKELAKIGAFTDHPGRVGYSPDGKSLAARFAWDAQTGQPFPLPDPEHVASSTFAPDSSRLACSYRLTTSLEPNVRLWDSISKRFVRTFERGDKGSTAQAFSADGTLLADARNNGDIRIWPVASEGEGVRLKGHVGKVRAVAFSPDGRCLASGGDDQDVRLWNLESGNVVLTLRGHNREITDVCFSPDGTRLVSTSGDIFVESSRPGEVKLWDLTTGRECLTFTAGGNCVFGGAAFSPDGRKLFAGMTRLPPKLGEMSAGAILVWDATPAETAPAGAPAGPGNESGVVEAEGFRSAIRAVAFSPKGDRLAVSTEKGSIVLVDVMTGDLVSQIEGHDTGPTTLVFSPGATQLLSLRPAWAGGRNELKVWDLSSGKAAKQLTEIPGYLFTAAFDPQGGRVLTVGLNKKVSTAVVLAEGTAAPEGFELTGHTGQLRLADIGGGGKYLATYTISDTRLPNSREEPRELKIWELETGKLLRTLTDLKVPLWGLQFSADGRRLAALLGGDRDPSTRRIRCEGVTIWDVATGREARTLTGVDTPIALSPDGQLVAVPAPESFAIRVLDVETGNTARTLPGGRWPLEALAFSPDGKRLVSNNGNLGLLIWDLTRVDYPGWVPTPRKQTPSPSSDVIQASVGEVSTLEGPAGWGEHAVFSSDGTHLAALAQSTPPTALHKSIRVWNVNSRTVAANLASTLLDRSVREKNVLKTTKNMEFHAFAFGPGAASKQLHSISRGQRETKPVKVPGTGADAVVQLDTWDVQTGKPIRASLPIGDGPARTYFFDPAGKRLGAHGNGKIMVRDVATGKLLTEWASAPYSVFVSADGNLVGSSGAGDALKAWDSNSGKLLLALETKDQDAFRLLRAAIAADGRELAAIWGRKVLAASPQGVLKAWSISDGKEARSLTISFAAFGQELPNLVFSPDGELLAGSRGQKAVVWETRTGKELGTLTVPKGTVAVRTISPDRKRLALVHNQSFLIWDLSERKPSGP